MNKFADVRGWVLGGLYHFRDLETLKREKKKSENLNLENFLRENSKY